MIALIESFNWREPLWLLLSLQPLVTYIFIVLARKLQNDHYAMPHLLPWAKLGHHKTSQQSLLKIAFLIIAWIAFAIAMAGPRVASKVISTDESSYTNVQVLLDVSRSMSAHDTYPSRLERAKLELLDLVERSQQTRIGIILYAARAHVLSPLTADKNLLRHYISTIKPSILPTRGSNLKHALGFTARQFDTSSSRAILLISDGDSPSSNVDDYEAILEQIKSQNITIYTLIIGSETGAPLLDNHSGWLTYEEKDVISKTNTELLKEIALRTNGTYDNVDDTDKDWQLIYDSGIAKLSPDISRRQAETQLVIWEEYYPWFLIIGVLCFLFANINISITRQQYRVSSLLLTVFIVFYATNSKTVFASEQYQKAYQAYQQKEYSQAEQAFSLLNSYAGRIGQASAAYQEKNYSKAIMLFIQASLEAQTDKQRVHALFNLANSYYQLAKYQQAASIYQDVLRYQPNHPQATINLDYALTLAKKQKPVKEDITTSRGGKGPRTARLTPNAEFGKGNLTLGDESETIPFSLSNKEDTHQVHEPDINAAGLVTQDIESGEDKTWTYSIRNIDELNVIANSIPRNEHVFWQRLYEWEEDFPAPLAKPVTVPGVKPW